MTTATSDEAVRSFRAHVGDFVCAAYVVSLPLRIVTVTSLTFGQRRIGWALLMAVVEAFGASFTLAALTLLAADVRRGGRWSWRRAWSVTLRRAKPVVDVTFASGVSYFVINTMALMSLRLLLPAEGGGPHEVSFGSVTTMAATLAVRLVVMPIVGLAMVVAVLERPKRGFRSIGEALGLLRLASSRAAARVWIAAAPAVLIGTLPLAKAIPRAVDLALAAVLPLTWPVLVFVNLTVYCSVRARGGDLTESLRTALT